MSDFAIKHLAAAVTMQAVKDYFDKESTQEERKAILKDLRSNWMRELTNDTSANVAEQLEKHPKEIAERLRRHNENVV